MILVSFSEGRQADRRPPLGAEPASWVGHIVEPPAPGKIVGEVLCHEICGWPGRSLTAVVRVLIHQGCLVEFGSTIWIGVVCFRDHDEIPDRTVGPPGGLLGLKDLRPRKA